MMSSEKRRAPNNQTNEETPSSALGYRMPAEWETHAATWLSWPHKLDSWPGKFEFVPAVFVEITKHLSAHETVNINVRDEEMSESVTRLLSAADVNQSNVRLHVIPTNDAWARDHGPVFITRRDDETGGKQLALVDWEFNAWGGKYPPFDLDNDVPQRIAETLGVRSFHPGIVMEGGSIDVNGRGTLMTTEACLLNPNRNPRLSKREIETYLANYLGVRHFLWLGDGIIGDDTDGHIDDLARFTDPSTVVTVLEDDPQDDNYELLRENHRRLLAMKDQDGEPLRIVTLPMPAPIEYEGQRLPASYANFYIANRTVLVPVFDQPHDRLALEVIQRLFPTRAVVGIYCADLVWGLGAIHCVTQQQPSID